MPFSTYIVTFHHIFYINRKAKSIEYFISTMQLQNYLNSAVIFYGIDKLVQHFG